MSDIEILEKDRENLRAEIQIKKDKLKQLDLKILKKKWPFEPNDRIKHVSSGEIRIFAEWIYSYHNYRPMAFKLKKNGKPYKYPNEIWFTDYDQWEKEKTENEN